MSLPTLLPSLQDQATEFLAKGSKGASELADCFERELAMIPKEAVLARRWLEEQIDEELGVYASFSSPTPTSSTWREWPETGIYAQAFARHLERETTSKVEEYFDWMNKAIVIFWTPRVAEQNIDDEDANTLLDIAREINTSRKLWGTERIKRRPISLTKRIETCDRWEKHWAHCVLAIENRLTEARAHNPQIQVSGERAEDIERCKRHVLRLLEKCAQYSRYTKLEVNVDDPISAKRSRLLSKLESLTTAINDASDTLRIGILVAKKKRGQARRAFLQLDTAIRDGFPFVSGVTDE